MLFFEDISIGQTWNLGDFQITQDLRDRHVAIYGEDWPDALITDEVKNIIPAPIVISMLAAQTGRQELFQTKVMKQFSVKCLKSIMVGDTINIEISVKDKLEHRESGRDYGYITVDNIVKNQRDEVCMTRVVEYLVYRDSK